MLSKHPLLSSEGQIKENDPSRFLSRDNFNYHHFVFSFVSLLAGPRSLLTCWS